MSYDKYAVICTLGDMELVKDNGEFYLVDTVNSFGKK